MFSYRWLSRNSICISSFTSQAPDPTVDHCFEYIAHPFLPVSGHCSPIPSSVRPPLTHSFQRPATAHPFLPASGHCSPISSSVRPLLTRSFQRPATAHPFLPVSGHCSPFFPAFGHWSPIPSSVRSLHTSFLFTLSSDPLQFYKTIFSVTSFFPLIPSILAVSGCFVIVSFIILSINVVS